MRTRQQRRSHGCTLLMALILCLVTAPIGVPADEVEEAGDIIQIALPLGVYGATFAINDTDGRMQLYKSFATTMGVTYALKYGLNRPRPSGGDHSFPSGHTSAAFSGASFIQRRYGWWYGAPAYLAASFVGWSRVDANAHYTEDVLAGAAIGIAATYAFTHPYHAGPAIVLFKRGDTRGIALEKRW
jgi:membrane-associated phospholipid phosphatase